jgi:hypothetical protein
LVEQQVVGLEVEGSTPSIYPILSKWLIQIDRRSTPLSQINWTLIHLSYLNKTLPDLYLIKLGSKKKINLNKFVLGPNVNPNYENFLANEFKLAYKNNLTLKKSVTPNNTKPLIETGQVQQLKLFKTFKSFLQVNSSSSSTLMIPHFSFKHFYLGYRRGGLSLLNVNKLFNRWKDAYYLMFNLFYYEIELLTFSTSFFKSEVLSLNWQVMGRFKFMWRYTKPFLTSKSNKITTYGDFIFYRLNLLGLRVALVVDILYHSKTIYYLHRSGFYSVGLVPVNYNINSVNFAIPTSSDSLLTQIFFIRFLSIIQQNSKNLKYKSNKSAWFGLWAQL